MMPAVRNKVQMTMLLRLLILIVSLAGSVSLAQTSDVEAHAYTLLKAIQPMAEAVGMDVQDNLNAPDVARSQLTRPRLGALADIPGGRQADAAELTMWEDAVANGEIGALFWMGLQSGHANDATGSDGDINTDELTAEAFWDQWSGSDLQAQRVVISFAKDDALVVVNLAAQLRANGGVFFAQPLPSAIHTQFPGSFYATAAYRWVVDSDAARDLEIALPEFLYLGEPTRGDSNSVLGRPDREERRLLASEPEIFRKSSLGDEFEASTIPEIIVPGGIAFGETAVLTIDANRLEFDGQRLRLLATDGTTWLFPEESLANLKASFDFAMRSMRIASDAVVDIDERGRVKLSAALRDTDAGYAMVEADVKPFEFIDYLPADKSIIIDNTVSVIAHKEQNAVFKTELEVRYLRADRRQIAQTRAAIKYRFDQSTGETFYYDDWGTDAARLRANSDYDGLGAAINVAANLAAWVALFRLVNEQELDFSIGRYQLMKIDKRGRETPSRF